MSDKKPKKIKLVLTSAELHCPVCKEPIPHRDGSFLWPAEDIRDTHFCRNCRRDFVVATRVCR